MTELYVVILSGIGEVQISLVDKELWDFIHDATPVSDQYIAAARTQCTTDIEHEDFIVEYEDSLLPEINWNDRAMMVAWFTPDQTFFQITKYANYLSENQVEIIQEVEGYIY
jgi:hypothetical protein